MRTDSYILNSLGCIGKLSKLTHPQVTGAISLTVPLNQWSGMDRSYWCLGSGTRALKYIFIWIGLNIVKAGESSNCLHLG